MAEKTYASDLPLPGGVEQYYDTLIAMLRHVATSPLSHDKVAEKFIEECPKAGKSKAMAMYIGLITRMGFWTQKDGTFKVSDSGIQLLEAAENDPQLARELVLKVKLRDVAGYDCLLSEIAKGPKSFDEMDSALKHRLNADWKSKNQTMFRVSWLRSLGYVERDGSSYTLTDSGDDLIAKGLVSGNGATPVPGPTENGSGKMVVGPVAISTPLILQAIELANRLEQAAISGGDGTELEIVTADVFKMLGFGVQLLSGSGNPDVIASAEIGDLAYRILVETKSRSSGKILQNDINYQVLEIHKVKANAEIVCVVGPGFSGGQLVEFAEAKNVRLICVQELKQILLAHAEAVIPLDRLQGFFQGGGLTDEDSLSEVLTESETASQLMTLCRRVYDAVLKHQNDEADLNENSLFFILDREFSIQSVTEITSLLQTEMFSALGSTETGGLFCRFSPAMFANRLKQISHVVGGEFADAQ